MDLANWEVPPIDNYSDKIVRWIRDDVIHGSVEGGSTRNFEQLLLSTRLYRVRRIHTRFCRRVYSQYCIYHTVVIPIIPGCMEATCSMEDHFLQITESPPLILSPPPILGSCPFDSVRKSYSGRTLFSSLSLVEYPCSTP